MLQILITLRDDGQLQVEGALQNRAMAYGMLELAKDAIQAMETAAKPPGIVPVRLMPGNGGPPAS